MARKYKRDRNGRFASGGTAVMTTTGRAGGFANPAHRARAASAKVRKQRRAKMKFAARAVGTVAAVGLTSALARNVSVASVAGNLARRVS